MNASEHQLQAKCIKAFREKKASEGKVDEINRLFCYFAETENAIQGATMLSLGLAKGASDLFYIDDEKRFIGIELKHPDSSHRVDHLKRQAKWLMTIPYKGYFCDSVDIMFEIINGGVGICPKKVFDFLSLIKTKTIKWNKVVDAIK